MSIDPRLGRKAARGLQGDQAGTADPVQLFLEALRNGIVPVYISNFGPQGTFGVHSHGWWRGGDVTFNPNTNATLSQTLVSAGQVGTAGDASGDQILRTTTAGTSFYLTSFNYSTPTAAFSDNVLRDGSGGTLRVNVASLTANEIRFWVAGAAPAGPFATNLFWDGGTANMTVSASWQGWEE